MPTPEEIERLRRTNPRQSQNTDNDYKAQLQTQYFEPSLIPPEYAYAAYMGGWDPHNPPQDMAETAWREQQERGEVGSFARRNFWTLATQGLDYSLESIWGNVDERAPQFSEELLPIYNNPNKTPRSIGSGYWRNQLVQTGTSVGMMVGMQTDPANIALTVASFIPYAGTAAAAANTARIANVVKKVGTANRLYKAGKFMANTMKLSKTGKALQSINSMKIANGLEKTLKWGFKAGVGMRNGNTNARINQMFVEDEVYTRLIQEGKSEDDAIRQAKAEGQKQYNLEKWVDMACGIIETGLLTRGIQKLRGANIAKAFRKGGLKGAAKPFLNATKDLMLNSAQEAVQEVWEEIAAIYGESDNLNSWKDLFTKEGYNTITKDKDRLIDSFIGGAMGGLLLGAPMKGVFAGAEAVRNYKANKNVSKAEEAIRNVIGNMIVRPEEIQKQLERKVMEAGLKVQQAKTSYSEMQDASRAERKKAMQDIKNAEEELQKAKIAASSADMDTLLAVKRSMMSLADADPTNIANLNDNFNASMEAKIDAITTIDEAVKAEPNILARIGQQQELNDNDTKVKEAATLLKAYGILDENGNITGEHTLEEYKDNLVKMHDESVAMDADFLEGYDRYGNEAMASRHMNLNAKKRNIGRMAEELNKESDSELKDLLDNLFDEKDRKHSAEDTKKVLQFLSNIDIDDALKNEFREIIAEKYAVETGIDTATEKDIATMFEENSVDDTEDIINDREKRKSEARERLMNSDDRLLRKLISTMTKKNADLTGKRKEKAKTTREGLIRSAYKILYNNRQAKSLARQQEAIDNILQDMNDESRAAYQMAKEAYYSCCIDLSNTAEDPAQMMEDINDAITLCDDYSLEHNKEIALYKKELQRRLTYLRSKNNINEQAAATQEQSHQMPSERNIKDNTDKEQKRNSVKDAVRNQLISSIKAESRAGDALSFLGSIMSEYGIKSKKISEMGAVKGEKKEEKPDRNKAIADCINDMCHGKAPATVKNVTQEEAETIKEIVDQVVEAKTNKVMQEVRQAVDVYEQQELETKVEEIAERHNISTEDITPAVTDMQTIFCQLKIVGMPKESPVHRQLLSSMANQVKLLGYDYNSVIKPNISTLLAIFRDNGFTDLTAQELDEAIRGCYEIPAQSNEEVIQEAEKKDRKLYDEHKKKIGTDYDILQFTKTEKDEKTGKAVFKSRVKKADGTEVMGNKEFARLMSLKPNGKNRIFIKGFSGSYSSNKAEFKKYLKEIFGYRIDGQDYAKKELFKAFGMDADTAFDNEEALKALWMMRNNVFALANQPVYATDTKGGDAVVVGFVPNAGYYSEKNCSLYEYKDGEKVMGTPQARQYNIAKLNNGTTAIANAQMYGDVEFDAGMRDRQTSEYNRSANGMTNANVTENTVTAGNGKNGMVNEMLYTMVTDNTTGKEVQVPIPIHFPGTTYIDEVGNIRVFTEATRDRMNLRQQNMAFFENYRNNITDIILKYLTNRLIEDWKSNKITDPNYWWNVCKNVVESNKDILLVDDMETATRRLYDYVDKHKDNPFNLDLEIKQKFSGSDKKQTAFLVKKGWNKGMCSFGIRYQNKTLYLALCDAENKEQMNQKMSSPAADTVKEINNLFNYVRNAFAQGGIAEKSLVSIIDYRGGKLHEKGNSLFNKVVCDNAFCGRDLASLENDDFTPERKEGKKVTDHINEQGRTDFEPVQLMKADGTMLYDENGLPQMTMFSGIIRTLKRKPGTFKSVTTTEKKSVVETFHGDAKSFIKSIKANSIVRKEETIDNITIINGLTALEQTELCKSLFAYIMTTDDTLRDRMIRKEVTVKHCIDAARKAIIDDKEEIFKNVYEEYYSILGILDRINGEKPKHVNKAYMAMYNADNIDEVSQMRDEVQKAYDILNERMQLIESLSSEENLDKLFHAPSMADSQLMVGSYLTYVTNLFGAHLTLDETVSADMEQDMDTTQNDSLEHHLKADYEQQTIDDLSSYLKCVLSAIPKEKDAYSAKVFQKDLNEYEDIETVMGVIGFALIQSRYNFDEFLISLSDLSCDKSFKYRALCRKALAMFINDNIMPEQYCRELMSKFKKSFTNMMYVKKSLTASDEKILITLNSVVGTKKKSYELNKAQAYCKNTASYMKEENDRRVLDMEAFSVYANEAKETATQIANGEAFDIDNTVKLLKDVFGIEISKDTIQAQKGLVRQLLAQMSNLAKEKDYKKTPYDFCRKELARLVEAECFSDENTLDKTSYIDGKTVGTTKYMTLKDKIMKDVSDGEKGIDNVTHHALDDMYKVEVDGKTYYMNPQYGLASQFPMATGLVSLSALDLPGSHSDRMTELSAEDQAAVECIYNTDSTGAVSEPMNINMMGFNQNFTSANKMRFRNGYTLSYTVSDKQKLSWIRCAKLCIPMQKYMDDTNGAESAGIDFKTLYGYVTQQILDSELTRIERELDTETKMPNKQGRHLILSIPELNMIEITVNGHRQDLETLLRRCYAEGTKEIFKDIRGNYNSIFQQAQAIVRKAIEQSVANLICNDEAKRQVAEGKSLLDGRGAITIGAKEMENSLWHRSTVMKLTHKAGFTFMEPDFVSSSYQKGVLNRMLPTPAVYDENDRLVKEGTVVQSEMEVAYMAFDQVVNTYLTGVTMHNICYGALNNVGKLKGMDSLETFDAGEHAVYKEGQKNSENYNRKLNVLKTICQKTAENNTKRTAGQEGAGRLLDFEGITHENDPEWGGGKEHHNSLFKYVIVQETEEIAPTYKDIVELYYGKQGEDVDRLIAERNTKELARRFPDVADYLSIDSTDGAEFVTAREAVDWLLGKGDLSKEDYDKLQKLYDKTSSDLTKEDQQLIWNLMKEARKVINPVKPMCYGVMALGKDGKPAGSTNKAVTMHTFYAKSAAIPLLPEFTANSPWDKVRMALEETEKRNRMNCRLIFNSAVKIGAPEASKIISIDRLIEIGSASKTGEIEANEIDNSSVYMHRNFLMSQMETNSHREEMTHVENMKERKVMNDIDEFLNNGQTKIVDSTQMEHIIDGLGINRIGEKIFRLPKRVCEQFNAKHENYMVDGNEFERIRMEFTQRRVNDEYQRLVEELGAYNEGGLSFENPKFVKSLAKILGNELLARGNDPNVLAQMGFIANFDEDKKTYDFKIPLFMQTKSRSMQVLLMAIVRNRLCKNKLPGNPMYTASSKYFQRSNVMSDADVAFRKRGVIWLDKNTNGILGSQLNDDGTLKCADIAIPSQFMTRSDDGRLQHLDLYAKDSDGKLLYLVDENGNALHVDSNGDIKEDHEGIYLNKEMIDNELIDKMMSLRIPVSGHMSGAAVRIVAFLPDSMGDTIIVPAEHFKQLGEDLDIDKRFLYLKNYVVDDNGHVSVLTEDKVESLIQSSSIEKSLKDFLEKRRTDIRNIENEVVTAADLLEFAAEIGLSVTSVDDMVYTYERANRKIREWYSEDLERKLRENENIDFYASVFTNPDKRIQRMIQRVLNFDQLKATRDFILDSQEEKGTDFISIFDNTYQSDVRLQNASSLAGVGAMSLAVVQGAMLSKRSVQLRNEFMMDGRRSNGNLGGVNGNMTTLDGKSTIDQELAALQNANVDNAKENVCGPINLNTITFPFYEMMAWLGFGYDSTGKYNVTALVAAQPSVKKFVELKNTQKSNLKLRVYSNADIVREVMRSCGIDESEIDTIFKGEHEVYEYENDMFVSKVRTKSDPYGCAVFNLSSEELQEGIKGEGNPMSQLQAFMFFYNIMKAAGAMTKYTNLLNATSKGIGDSYFDIVKRIRLLNDMGDDTNPMGFQQLIGDFLLIDDNMTAQNIDDYVDDGYITVPGCNYLIRPTTTEGIVMLNTLKMSEKLLSECFGYKKDTFRFIYDKILNTMFNSNIPIETIEKMEKQIPEALKQYLYKLCGGENFMEYVSGIIGTDVEGLFKGSYSEEEKRLLTPYYDEFKLDSNEAFNEAMREFTDEDTPGDRVIELKPGEHVSLGYIITFLQRANIQSVTDNKFLSSLSLNKNGAISYRQKANTLANSDMTNGFIELFNNKSVIQINGHDVVANGKKLTFSQLAHDIAAYAYICDNENGVLNLREHIPDQYITMTGTDKVIRFLYDNLGTFVDSDSFLEQFFGTYPDGVPTYSAKNKAIKDALVFTMKDSTDEYSLDSASFPSAEKVIIKDQSKEFLAETGWEQKDGVVNYPEFIAIKSGDNTLVFRIDETTGEYRRIRTRVKDFGKNTFDPNESPVVRGINNASFTKIQQQNAEANLIKFTASNSKNEIVGQIRSKLVPSHDATKIINILLESILNTENISVNLTINNEDNPTTEISQDADGSIRLNLQFTENMPFTVLAEEMMHVAQLLEISRAYELDSNGDYVPKKDVKNDLLSNSYSIYQRFKKWWASNGAEYMQRKRNFIQGANYENQILKTANNFAEFIAAGASLHPVFLDAIDEFEKAEGMTRGNVVEQTIEAIKRIFRRIIETIYRNQPETVKTILDDTLRSINKYFLKKNADNALTEEEKVRLENLMDKETFELLNKVDRQLYGHNDPNLIDIGIAEKEVTPQSNIREQFRGKIVVAPYGMGKSTAADNESVIDMDYIWAEALANYTSNFDVIVESDVWARQKEDNSDMFRKMRDYVIRRCNALLDEGKTILASPTILNGTYGNLADSVGGIVAAKNMKEDIISNMLNRRNQFDNREGYTKRLEEQLDALREFVKKKSIKSVFVDQYISDVIYDGENDTSDKNTGFAVTFSEDGNRTITPVKNYIRKETLNGYDFYVVTNPITGDEYVEGRSGQRIDYTPEGDMFNIEEEYNKLKEQTNKQVEAFPNLCQ